MKILVVVSFFLCLVQGLKFTNFGIPLGQQVTPNVYSLNFEKQDAYGSTIKMNYDAKVIPNIVNLEHDANVKNVVCTSDALIITYKSKQDMPIYEAGVTLVGGLVFGCLDEDNKPGPFYRTVVSKLTRRFNQVSYITQKKNFLECFEQADIKFYKDPASKSKRFNYFGPVDKTDTFTLWGWNYNGAGGASQELDIFQHGGKLLGGQYEVDVKCTSCYAYIDAGLEWALYIDSNWGWPRLQQLKLRGFGDLVLNADVEGDFHYQYQLDKEITIFGPTDLPTITFEIGPVPVVIVPEIELVTRLNVDVEAQGKGTIGFDYSKSISAGFEYRHSWGEIRSIPPDVQTTFNYHTPTFTFEVDADLRATLIPKFTLKLYSLAPFFVKLIPYIGAKLAIGTGSGCSALDELHYQLYGGLDLDIGLDQITFNFLHIKLAHVTLGKSVGLPVDKYFTIIPQEDLSCSFCAGCLDVVNKKRGGSSTYWQAGEWSNCTLPCNGGTQTRVVTCMSGAGTVDDTLCDHDPKPAASRSCNQFPCPVDCGAIGTCSACVAEIQCGWCASNNNCETIYDLLQDSSYITSTCPAGLSFVSCTDHGENQIIISTPTNALSTDDNSTVLIEWSGGPTQVFIVWRWSNETFWHSAGQSSNAIDASISKQYNWVLDQGIPSASTYELAVVSATHPLNYDIVTGFTVNGASRSHFWGQSLWSACSLNCETGTQSREVQCHSNTGTEVNDLACSFISSKPPPQTRSCTTGHACSFFPLRVRKPILGEVLPHNNWYEIIWSGGKEGNDIVIESKTENAQTWSPLVVAPNSGAFEWKVSGDEGVGYQIRLRSLNEDSNNVTSDKFFVGPQSASTLLTANIFIVLMALYVTLCFM